MKQIIVIHGGSTFESYEDFIDWIKTENVTIDSFKPRKDWKASLQEKLGTDYEILSPRMPNRDNAKYTEWRIWFERMIPFVRDDAIFIGHSMGGIFLAKYLSENKFPNKILAVLLVSSPYESWEDESVGDFILPKDLSLLKQAKDIHLFFSKDDPIVPFSHFEKYKEKLPNAKTRIFSDRGHFMQEEFPEIIEIIQSLK